jgi:hypothetical protein
MMPPRRSADTTLDLFSVAPNSTRGKVILCQGIRPDTLLIIGQFEQWVTP